MRLFLVNMILRQLLESKDVNLSYLDEICVIHSTDVKETFHGSVKIGSFFKIQHLNKLLTRC